MSAIYLFKAARRPQYRKENLHLLAEEHGTVLEFAYNRIWVAPEFFDEGSIRRGERVHVMFTERPYARFVPVRGGEVVSARWDDLMLRIRVALHAWEGVEEVPLDTFTRIVKQAAPEQVPGNKFVARKHDGVQIVPYFDEREEAGWRKAVQATLEMSRESGDDPYRSSVFFRRLGVQVGEEDYRPKRVVVAPGTDAKVRLSFFNPHLSEEDVAGYTLRALPSDDGIDVTAPHQIVRKGELEVGCTIHGGQPAVTIQIGPAPADHTHLVERFRTADDDGVPPAIAPVDAGARAAELLSIYDFVRRNCQFPAAADEEDFFDKFRQLVPGNPRIVEEWGLWAKQHGDAAKAYRLLREVDQEQLSESGRLALFELTLRHHADARAANMVEPLGLLEETPFQSLVDLLERQPPGILAGVAGDIAQQLTAEQMRDFLPRVGNRLESPQAIVAVGNCLAYAHTDATWAFNYVAARTNTLHLADIDVENFLLDLVATGEVSGGHDDVRDVLPRRISNLIETGKVDEARKRMSSSLHKLGSGAREKLCDDVVTRLLRRRMAGDAVDLLLEIGWHSLSEGELEAAADAVDRAGVICSAHEPARDREGAVAECRDRVVRAYEESAELRDWRRSAQEARHERIRRHYKGRRILIAGGARHPDIQEKLEQIAGADIDWCQVQHTENMKVESYAEKCRNGYYAVVLYNVAHTGHSTGHILRPACEDGGVRCVSVPTAGLRNLLEVLDAEAAAATA
jgi:hypothetical protein